MMVSNKFLKLKSNHKNYAVPIESVIEILKFTTITAIPKTPSYLVGVVNLRGRIVPTIDLRMKIDHEMEPSIEGSIIVVVEVNQTYLGIVVDEVSDVKEYKSEQINISEKADSEPGTYVQGNIRDDDEVIIILDVAQFFGDTKDVHIFSGDPSHAA